MRIASVRAASEREGDLAVLSDCLLKRGQGRVKELFDIGRGFKKRPCRCSSGFKAGAKNAGHSIRFQTHRSPASSTWRTRANSPRTILPLGSAAGRHRLDSGPSMVELVQSPTAH